MSYMMVVFADHWAEFHEWLYDPEHLERREMPMVEACGQFLQEKDAA